MVFAVSRITYVEKIVETAMPQKSEILTGIVTTAAAAAATAERDTPVELLRSAGCLTARSSRFCL